jgi:hypothetical protein
MAAIPPIRTSGDRSLLPASIDCKRSQTKYDLLYFENSFLEVLPGSMGVNAPSCRLLTAGKRLLFARPTGIGRMISRASVFMGVICGHRSEHREAWRHFFNDCFQ